MQNSSSVIPLKVIFDSIKSICLSAPRFEFTPTLPMAFELQSLKSILKAFLQRNFASASVKNKKVASAKNNAKPEKQKLMKKQKLASSNSKESVSSRRGNSNDRAVPFTRALFSVENSIPIMDREEVLRREVIAKSWSRWKILKLHQDSTFEADFIKSRTGAMQQLQAISPILADKASRISYEPAPFSLKPSPESLPTELPFN